MVAGDICFPGPEPLATWRRLSQLNAICVQGVGDRALATISPDRLRPRDDFERHRVTRLRDVRLELGERVLAQIAKLPTVVHHPLDGGRMLTLVHGAPADPMEELTHDMSDQGLEDLVGGDAASIILCGGSHVPFDRTLVRRSPPAGLPEQVRIINVGSVGEAPAADEQPGRFAHATFVESTAGGVEVEQFVVPLGRAAA